MANTFFKKDKFLIILIAGGLIFSALTSNAQNDKTKAVSPPLVVPDTSKNTLLLPLVIKDTAGTESLTLRQCIDYAMQHQPGINKALINVDVAKTTNAINLSGWLPQVNAQGTFDHYLQSPSNGSTVSTSSSGATSTTVSHCKNNITP